LRTLLIVVLLLSLPLGWFAFKMRQAERQRKAVEAIREAGGVVGHVCEWRWLGPLRGLLGEDFFGDVVFVAFDDSAKAGDVELEQVEGLTELGYLSLSRTQGTEAGLEHLKGLTKLESLQLGDTRVGDTGLEHLRGLTKLETLVLTNTEISDAGLSHLKGLTRLKSLFLANAHVTEEGIYELRKALPDCYMQCINSRPLTNPKTSLNPSN